MALSTTDLQTRIDALRRARDSGVLIVKHGDEMTQFRTLAEMNSVLADLESELAKSQGAVTPRVKYIEQRSKGFGRPWTGLVRTWDDWGW